MTTGPRELRVETEYGLVRLLAEAGALDDATQRLFELIAGAFGWSAGGLLLIDAEAGLLRWADDWSTGDPELVAFLRLSRRLTWARGIGLPGRVWDSGEPAWIPDVTVDPNFPRVQAATAAGLKAAVAFPIAGPEGPLGVIEFFGTEAREPEAEHLELIRTAGRQMGQFLARVRAEERLRASEERNAAIVHAALDCVITIDAPGVVIDFNPAAEATFGYSREEAVGRELAELIVPPELRDAHRAALARYRATGQPSILGRRLELTGMRADGTTLPVELTITRIGTQEPPMFAGFLRDITERQRAQDELAELLVREHEARVRAETAEREARSISDALQRSLLPPHLPSVPSVELGAGYLAGGEGLDVGGDFYDIFDLGDGHWGIAIGDVRGKGAGAAAVTGLVRYTLRTAAVGEPSPRAVLQVVNDALLRELPDGDFCTAVYARLDTTGSSPRLTAAVGGHPPPLVARAGGDVVAAGHPGTLLGAVAHPDLTDAEVVLGPGDVLLLYTDGVTESRTPGGRLGLDGLSLLLGTCGGLDAEAIAGRVLTAAAGPRREAPDDDIALLVVRAPA
jgi:PAS domain S-box-containing protein